MASFFERDGYYSVFSGPGVIERNAHDLESSYKLGIFGAYRQEDISKGPDDLMVVFDNGQGKWFPVDLEQVIVDADTGAMIFTAVGGDYVIRKVTQQDSDWISPGTDTKSIVELEAIIMGTETSAKEYKGELDALSQDDSTGPIYAITLTNDLGMFQRRNGIWLQLPSDHEEFDGLFGTFIDMARADEFIELYDKGGMTVEVADTFQK